MKRAGLAILLAASMLILPVPRARAEGTFPEKADARIVISQDQQRMLIYEGAILVRSLPVSTGWPGQRQTITPTWRGPIGRYWGTFAAFGTVQDDGYWLFTDYLPNGRWNGDILIHGAPYLVGPDGEKRYDVEGIGTAPVSHGCIRLLPEDIAWFRAWDPRGVEVEIQPFSDPAVAIPKLARAAMLLSAERLP